MTRMVFMAIRTLAIFLTIAILFSLFARAQSRTDFTLQMPHSYNPLKPYTPDEVPEPALANSTRIDQLVRDGKLYLSLKDAIALALENNLDLAIARYNIPIADTDLLRTKAGGFFRGVNTGVVQGTPGGGVGGYGAGAPGRFPTSSANEGCECPEYGCWRLWNSPRAPQAFVRATPTLRDGGS